MQGVDRVCGSMKTERTEESVWNTGSGREQASAQASSLLSSITGFNILVIGSKGESFCSDEEGAGGMSPSQTHT